MNTDNSENKEDTPAADASDRRPIGYWLRAVDALITREFATALAKEGVTRREWMALNALSGDVDAPGLAERLARKGKLLRGLAERGWVEEQGDGTWSLTDDGRTAKERIGEAVNGIRARVAGAVSPEEFATTMATLEAVARELGWDEESARRFGRGRGRGFGVHRGFGRGFGPGHGHGFGPGFGPGHGHGFAPEHTFAREDGCHGHGEHHGEHDAEFAHGHHGHHHPGHGHAGHNHAGHGHHRGRGREQAFERGFAAGYAARNTDAA